MTQIKKTLSIAGIIALATVPAMAEIASTQYVQNIVNTKQDALPSGTAGQILTQTDNGIQWTNAPEILELPENIIANTATGTNSFAVGNNVTATGEEATAIGVDTSASGEYSLAINGIADASGAIAIGVNANASGEYSLAISGTTDASGAIAIGANAGASGVDSLAINGYTGAYEAIAIGGGDEIASAGAEVSIAIGAGAYTFSPHSMAIGSYANVDDDAEYAIQLGRGTNDVAHTFNVGLGEDYNDNYTLLESDGKIPVERMPSGLLINTATGTDSFAIGNNVEATGEGATAIGGFGAQANGDYSLAINGTTGAYEAIAISGGDETASAGGEGSIAIGAGATVHEGADFATAIGPYTSIGENAPDAIAFGADAHVDDDAPYAIQLGGGTNSVARTFNVGLGYNNDTGEVDNYTLLNSDGKIPLERISNSYEEGSLAIGRGAEGLEQGAVAIGARAEATNQAATAVGAYTDATGTNSVALGYAAKSTKHGAVQLGEGTNNTKETLQFRSFPLVNANGMIPYERFAPTPDATCKASVGQKCALVVTWDGTEYSQSWEVVRSTSSGQ